MKKHTLHLEFKLTEAYIKKFARGDDDWYGLLHLELLTQLQKATRSKAKELGL